ncbi:MAG: NUDIX hydrolase, partial [Beijerinckiaceae bacterium]|nr:NUDIX hydrolase [Beijerinckiaceae bacterium]
VLRELEEETGVGFADVDVGSGWTVVQLGARIACMREISLRLPAVEAARAIEATLASQTEPELSAMHVISSLQDARAHDMPDFMQAFFRHALAD